MPFLVPFLDPILQNFIRHGKPDPDSGDKKVIKILYWNAWASMMIAMVLFVELFTPSRSFLLFIVYVQFLFIRNSSTDGAARHQRMVTAEMKVKTDGIFHSSSCPGIITKGYDLLIKGIDAFNKRAGGPGAQKF